MTKQTRFVGSWLAASVLTVCVAVPTADAAPFTIPCNTSGDAFGWSVASGGDYNDDGYDDIVVGAPCAVIGRGVGTKTAAGRVRVISGKNGKTLLERKGTQADQYLGAAVAFIDDLNGDDRDEIVVGSPGFDVPARLAADPLGGDIPNGGKVEVIVRANRGSRTRMRIVGDEKEGGLGEYLTVIEDIDADNRDDIVVGAPNERGGERGRRGQIHVFSGRNGDLLAQRTGEKKGAAFGSAIASSSDINGDGMPDVIAGSPELNVGGIQNAGKSSVFNGTLEGDPSVERQGTRSDRMGTSVANGGDRDDDGRSEFLVGSSYADNTGVKQAGEVSLFAPNGVLIWQGSDPEPQEKARFGTSVANVGDLNDDGIDDFLGGAPEHDGFANRGGGFAVEDAGRAVALDGADGSSLWEMSGDEIGQELGFSLAPIFDFDLGFEPDFEIQPIPEPDPLHAVLVGSRGDTPNGKRGAGTVKLISKDTGKELRSWGGKHGLETRIYTSNPDELVGFDPFGRAKTPQADIRAAVGAMMSVTVVDDNRTPLPGEVLVAFTGGEGATGASVRVLNAGEKDGGDIVTFDALRNAETLDRDGVPVEDADPIDGGVNIAAGNLFNDTSGDRMVTVQAMSEDGNVLARIFTRLDEQSGWFLEDEFGVFFADDTFELETNFFVPIDATGGTVAVGNVSSSGTRDEIIVAAQGGLPIVRVYTRSGTLISEWLAYDPADSDGVQVCVADVGGTTELDILTVPTDGEPLIKAFRGNGARASAPGLDGPVSIMPDVPEGFAGGGRACGADVDFDGVHEVVFIPLGSTEVSVQAYELDGKPVESFEPFDAPGTGLATTDSFVRR